MELSTLLLVFASLCGLVVVRSDHANSRGITECQSDELSYQGHCYWQSYGYWATEAHETCRRRGGHLVKIDDVSENRWLAQQINLTVRAGRWIGLMRNNATSGIPFDGAPKYRWLADGSVPIYTNFEPHDADDAGFRCVLMLNDGTWQSSLCERPHIYTCERSPLASIQSALQTLVNNTLAMQQHVVIQHALEMLLNNSLVMQASLAELRRFAQAPAITPLTASAATVQRGLETLLNNSIVMGERLKKIERVVTAPIVTPLAIPSAGSTQLACSKDDNHNFKVLVIMMAVVAAESTIMLLVAVAAAVWLARSGRRPPPYTPRSPQNNMAMLPIQNGTDGRSRPVYEEIQYRRNDQRATTAQTDDLPPVVTDGTSSVDTMTTTSAASHSNATYAT